MTPKLRNLSWASRNPLGIIALFISLIYGISALLLGSSIDSLQDYNETILILFVVLFPFAVLGVFGWLVACHHKKLYGPGDYQSDQGFIDVNHPYSSNEAIEQMEEEVKHDAESDYEANKRDNLDEGDNINGVGDSPGNRRRNNDSDQEEAEKLKVSREKIRQMATRNYFAQSLVFQKLSARYNGKINEHVSIKSNAGDAVQVDGIINTKNGMKIVEVKFIRNAANIARRFRESSNQLKWVHSMLQQDGYNVDGMLLVFVVDGDENDFKRVESYLKHLNDRKNPDVEMEAHYYNSLLQEFGVTSEGRSTANGD